MGERAPPISLQQPMQFKAKPTRKHEKVKWSWVPFKNDARTDALLLHSWRKKVLDTSTAEDGQDQQMNEVNSEVKESQDNVQPYPFAKYNIQAEAPTFDDDQYETNLRDENWTLEETRYLVDLYHQMYGKWPLIFDRYEYEPALQSNGSSETESQVSKPPSRSMEDLKHRFYQVKAKMMALETPITQMNGPEFEDYEKMLKFNRQQEVARKKIMDGQLTRSKEEKKEEEYLLAELRRIYFQQERFNSEVREVRDRLDHSLTSDKGPSNQYTTSGEITALFQRFMQQDKYKRPRKSIQGEGVAASPSTAGPTGQGHNAVGPVQKRGSISQDPSSHQRHLAPRAQARWGVSMVDRVTSGITFRSDKLAKVRQAKSQIQTQKIAGILVELEVPDLLQMPTMPVVNSMERLVSKVTTLLDVRKVREKSENENMVVQSQVKEQDKKVGKEGEEQKREGSQQPLEDGERQESRHGSQADVSMADADVKDRSKGPNPDIKVEASEGAQPSPSASGSAAQTRSEDQARNKRSASVMSTSSTGSGRASSKRMKAR